MAAGSNGYRALPGEALAHAGTDFIIGWDGRIASGGRQPVGKTIHTSFVSKPCFVKTSRVFRSKESHRWSSAAPAVKQLLCGRAYSVPALMW